MPELAGFFHPFHAFPNAPCAYNDPICTDPIPVHNSFPSGLIAATVSAVGGGAGHVPLQMYFNKC
jgi:hypothetical protein